MGFFDSINEFLQLCNLGECPYRITILGSKGIFIEGVLKICDIKNKEISLLVKGKKLVIEGSNLSIGAYVEKDLTVYGLVEKLSWQ